MFITIRGIFHNTLCGFFSGDADARTSYQRRALLGGVGQFGDGGAGGAGGGGEGAGQEGAAAAGAARKPSSTTSGSG
jgi:hypothetical protein